jgi:hypothetical protein
MIYGIEQTTDSRYPETKIVNFSSRKRTLESVKDSGGAACAGGARSDIPRQEQNWHARLRNIYEMPVGWRPPARKEQNKFLEGYRHSSYRRTSSDAIARAVRHDGRRLWSCRHGTKVVTFATATPVANAIELPILKLPLCVVFPWLVRHTWKNFPS